MHTVYEYCILYTKCTVLYSINLHEEPIGLWWSNGVLICWSIAPTKPKLFLFLTHATEIFNSAVHTHSYKLVKFILHATYSMECMYCMNGYLLRVQCRIDKYRNYEVIYCRIPLVHQYYASSSLYSYAFVNCTNLYRIIFVLRIILSKIIYINFQYDIYTSITAMRNTYSTATVAIL